MSKVFETRNSSWMRDCCSARESISSLPLHSKLCFAQVMNSQNDGSILAKHETMNFYHESLNYYDFVI